MEAVFLKLLNMSITAGWLALVVILVRLVFKKAPKALTVALWGLVGLRLLLPWSFESIFSLIPSAETVPQNITTTNTPQINSGVGFFNSAVNPVISDSLAPTPGDSVNPMQIVVYVATAVWLVGVAVMLIYTTISFIRIRRRVDEAVQLRDNVYLCDQIDTPFILGVIRPKIYLPSSISESDTEYVLAHETAHLKRHDHLIKPLSFLLLSVYWFNPLLWVSYVLLCRDIELACDEKVLKQMGVEAKKPYSTALINCSIKRRSIAACPLAFGEVGVKSRIKAVLNYKRPAFWIIVVCVVVSCVLGVCFLTNPKTVKMKNVENMNLDLVIENTVNVYVGRGNTYSPALERDTSILSDLVDLKVVSQPASQSRSEERDAQNVIVLQTKSDIKSISSKIEGVYICFSSEFSEVWINDGVKPTFSHKVFDPQKAQELFMSIKTVEDERFDDLSALREKFPEYFNLPTDKGLEVYIWQMSKSNYQCGLMAGTNFNKTDEQKQSLKPATIQEMRLILSTYSLPTNDIFLIAYNHPLSSYSYEINGEYYVELHKIFWHDDTLSSIGGADDPESITKISTAVYGFLSSPDPVRPTLKLTSGLNIFNFSWSGYSSYIAVGKYEQENGRLMLSTSDGLYTYVFEAVGDRYKFLANESSPIPKYKYSTNSAEQSPVPDGAMFEPIASESTGLNVPVYDSIEFDVDGDGLKEKCTITPGPTSGLFTVTLSAVSAKSEYSNIFMPGDPCNIAFAVVNGKLTVHCTEPNENSPILYEVSVKDGRLQLTFDNGQQEVPYWGNQFTK